MLRYTTFRANHDYIEQINQKNLGFTCEVNKFADWTDEELRLGAFKTEKRFEIPASEIAETPKGIFGFPNAVNWVDYQVSGDI